jgi:hypothetical protein
VTIILDTNVLSELRLPDLDHNVAAWLATVPEEEIAIAAFTVAEIEFGIARTPKAKAILAAQLTTWLEAILATQRILPLDAASARILGRLHAIPALRNLATTPPQARKPSFGGDLIIAAIATAHGTTVATRNVDDFRLITGHCPGLSGINPWNGDMF